MQKDVLKSRYANLTQLFLFVLFVIYFSQGPFFPQGTLITRAALVLILAFCFFYLAKTLLLKNTHSGFYKVWTFLLFLNIIGFIFTGDFSISSHEGMLRGIFLSLLPFYPFYYFSIKEKLNLNFLIGFFLIMIPITIAQYYYKEQQILLESSSFRENIVNNTAYTIASLIPFLFLITRKKILSFLLLFLFLSYIVISAKRGALVTGAIGLFFVIFYHYINSNRKYKVFSFLFLGSIAIGAFTYFYRIIENNPYLFNRIEATRQGYSSGRDIIFLKVLDGWYNSDNYFNLIFGYGFAASREFAGNYAHNDWLELLSNFGLIGVLTYLILFFQGLKLTINSQISSKNKIAMYCILSTWFMTSLFSMGYTSNEGYLKAILLGVLVAGFLPEDLKKAKWKY